MRTSENFGSSVSFLAVKLTFTKKNGIHLGNKSHTWKTCRILDDSSLPIIQGIWSASEVTISCTHILGKSSSFRTWGSSKKSNRCIRLVLFLFIKGCWGHHQVASLWSLFLGWQLGLVAGSTAKCGFDDRKNWDLTRKHADINTKNWVFTVKIGSMETYQH